MPRAAARRSDAHSGRPEDDVLPESKVKAVIEFNQAHNIPFFKEDVFRYFGVSRRTGYRVLHRKEGGPKLRPDGKDPRGRKRKLTNDDVRRLENILEQRTLDTPPYTWASLAHEAGLAESSWRTISRCLGDLEFSRCVQCAKYWMGPHIAQKRLEFARLQALQRPNWPDWKDVRFSGELHFALSSSGVLHLLPRHGERRCSECTQDCDQPEEDVAKRWHCWAMIGWDYKSDLAFYDVPGNKHGAMLHKVYVDSILYPHVLPALERNENFVLEEEGDFGHGSADRSNIVRQWKAKHGLKHFFNPPKSPDLSVIESCSRPLKLFFESEQPHSDEESARKAVIKGWRTVVSQEFINDLVQGYPTRLHDVLRLEGKPTDH